MTLVVAAIARRLTVAIWYLLMGRWTPLEEVTTQLNLKVGKLISTIGAPRAARQSLREQVNHLLLSGRAYVLKPVPSVPAPQ